jgi:hypothetical protein
MAPASSCSSSGSSSGSSSATSPSAFSASKHLTLADYYSFEIQYLLLEGLDLASEQLDFAADGLHINPLKFLVMSINVWHALKLLSSSPPSMTGYIIDLPCDNTSAISWLRIAARVRNPGTRHLGGLSSIRISCPCVLTNNYFSDSSHPRTGER